jgi:hypothetical protein
MTGKVAVISGALDRFGRIDTLGNNAGVYLSKPDRPGSSLAEGEAVGLCSWAVA